MKISVNSTFSYVKFNLNYGSVLQCYALQQYLSDRGHEPRHLRDYRANPVYILRRLKNIRYFSSFCKKSKAIIKVQKFMKKYMAFSERGYLSDYSLRKHPPKVDCHIAGSDQIWHNDNSFRYLDYAPDNTLKLSYAASFGKAQISDRMKNTITPYLRRFDGISVREKSAVDIVASMGLESEWVLDPTLLIDSERYPAAEPQFNDYYYCYFLNLSDKENVRFSSVKSIAADNNKNLLITAPLNYMMFSDEKLLFPSVEEWLGLYKNAKCIFTNTYHGLLFCIIFKKQFVFFSQTSGQKAENERFYSLLEMLSLQDRMVTADMPSEEIEMLIQKEIDYDSVYNVIHNKRQETDKFFNKFGI